MILDIYLCGVFATMARTAYLNHMGNAREFISVIVFWPVVWVYLALYTACGPLRKRGWRFDIQYRRDLSVFGTRRANPHWGRSLRVFWVEFQLWRVAC